MPVHSLTFPDTDSKEYNSARYHYLLQIIFGETIATGFCDKMATFAPTNEARNFLLQQQKEEDAHLELLTDYVSMHPRPQVSISPYLKKLDSFMVDALARKDYVECVFIQNFIVEGLNISLLRELEHHTDVNLSEMSRVILKDEIGHMEFGVSELRRILKEDPSKELLRKLIKLHRKTLIYSALLAQDLKREAKYLGIPMKELTEKTLSEHYDRINRAQFPLPYIDRLLFRVILSFLNL